MYMYQATTLPHLSSCRILQNGACHQLNLETRTWIVCFCGSMTVMIYGTSLEGSPCSSPLC